MNNLKNDINNLELEITEMGKEIFNNIGSVEIYKKLNKNITRKNRLEKNRIKKIKIKKYIKYFRYPYYINLRKMITILENSKSEFKILKDGKIKVMDMSLLPEYECIFEYKKLEEKCNNLRKRLKGNKNFCFTFRKSIVVQEFRIREKNNDISSKRKNKVEIIVKDDFNRDRGKYVTVKRIIDRKKDLYGEKIIDKENNEIIRECYEPLSVHRERGNAKHKK